MKKQENLSANADEKPEFSLIDENLLKSKIYTICGLKVMLDADLAEIYGYETRKFNEQVKHNIKKFDDDFRFQLSESEFTELKSNLMSKIWTSSWGGVRKQPFAFTEQGIYMLMTVLRGEQAIAQSKALIRLFKQMKDYIVAETSSCSEMRVLQNLPCRPSKILAILPLHLPMYANFPAKCTTCAKISAK